MDTLHIIDDLALVTRAALIPSPTIATTLKYAPDGWHRAYAWGFSIAVEELQDQVPSLALAPRPCLCADSVACSRFALAGRVPHVAV